MLYNILKEILFFEKVAALHKVKCLISAKSAFLNFETGDTCINGVFIYFFQKVDLLRTLIFISKCL